jgi:hypothetical protein
VVDIFRDILVQFTSDGSHSPVDVVRTAVSGMGQFTSGMVSSGLATLRGDLFFGFDRLSIQFAQSISSDSEPPITGTEGRQVLRRIYDTLEAGEMYK